MASYPVDSIIHLSNNPGQVYDLKVAESSLFSALFVQVSGKKRLPKRQTLTLLNL